MKKIIYIILLIFFCIPVFADNTYPFILKEIANFNDGKYYSYLDSNNEVNFFQIQTRWENSGEFLYSWKGIEKQNVLGQMINNIEIQYAKVINQKLYAIAKYEDKLVFLQISKDLQVKKIADLNNVQLDFINKVEYICQINSIVYLQINDLILSLDLKNNEIKAIDNGILAASNLKESIYFAKQKGNLIHFYELRQDRLKEINRIEFVENIRLVALENSSIICISSFNKSTSLQLININLQSKQWIDATSDLIYVGEKSEPYALYIKKENNQYLLQKVNLFRKNDEHIVLRFPSNLFEIQNLKKIDDNFICTFRNGLVILDSNLNMIALKYISMGEEFDEKYNLNKMSDRLIISNDKNFQMLLLEENKYWWLNNLWIGNGLYFIYFIALLLLTVFWQMYRHQKRWFNILLDLQSSGFVFILNQNANLIKINEKGKSILQINGNVPLKRSFAYYCISSQSKPLVKLLDKAFELKEDFSQKLSLQIDGQIREFSCRFVVMRNINGSFKGIIFTGIDITEELERQRLSNWAQLAHDMQTNLSTIRLNAEQMDLNDEKNINRKRKIVQQVNLLITRVRDIVTVGRSEKITKSALNSADICNELQMEFDTSIFEPQIIIESEIIQFQVYCDKAKLIRGLRNAVENAIKAISNKGGKIIISCYNDKKYAYFVIKDNGPGMNDETKTRMLTPYFTTGESSGGSGIGTMIMQNVIEQLGGNIIVNSELNKGTEIIFKFPNIVS